MKSLKTALFSFLHEIEERVGFEEQWGSVPSEYTWGRVDALRTVLQDAGLLEEYERMSKK